MSKVSTELSASTSNNESLILQALNSSNQRNVAEKLGVDASTLSRMKNDKKSNGLTDIELFAGLLSAIGLKVVPESDVYCSPEIAEATRVYLAHAFTSPEYMRILFK
ncbi:XRE family transcriptional regulator [Acinetobacter nosocomialis]|uniref:CII family transcriptional regulator n=1 Tax=Acinetobacter nosocomialis TaxID=106654 RepID=UPI00177E2B28|nr:CII family transcriptional regulator [Acinetobacter nosocomialis]MBD8351714.1 XRE family transcriptional regulator [Acinetobacter nosocomialis]